MVDTDLGFDLITCVCLLGDRVPLSMDDDALDNVLHRELSLFSHVSTSSFI